MLQNELFRVGEILVTAMARQGAKRWPHDMRAFAVAVNNLKSQSKLATQFHITMDAAGYYSYEFREILTLMHSATLISYDSVDTDWFRIRLSKRSAQVLITRSKASEEELFEATELVREHWLVAIGKQLETSS